MSLVTKLSPSRFPNMSGQMAAIVGAILQERFTDPYLAEICITSDGYVLGRLEGDIGMNEFIGSEADLRRNWDNLLSCAGLTPKERKAADQAFARIQH